MNLMAVALLMALVPAPIAPELAALGDSYAAGVGAERHGPCGRGDNAYPALYAKQTSASLIFLACSGATVDNVLQTQVPRITPPTSIVTVTVGGNDAGFADVMTTCVLNGDSVCRRAVDRSVSFIRTSLGRRLDGLYAAIRAKTPAKVVVLGYPRLFEPAGSCSFSVAKRTALNGAADVLDEVIGARAKAAGFGFGDVRTTFAGHGLCGRSPWLNNVTFPIASSFHPTATGQRLGYLPVLLATL
ncbi:SGNH/GDSL hydrolase family protein [Actinosynnema sp. NPDC020468]|uniref:SGNH/GDSL hydrolase family protein n=1 Tax=Actinosynnema sp. NPDC020468 TaxID=3154488 RepID=UPI0033FFED8B